MIAYTRRPGCGPHRVRGGGPEEVGAVAADLLGRDRLTLPAAVLPLTEQVHQDGFGVAGPVRINGNYGDGNVLGSNSTPYIDKTAFVDPAAFAFGNMPRTLPYNLRNTVNSNQDLSVRREFAIHEWARLALQGDFFNITNRVQFTGIGTNIDSSNFGMVSAQANSPRKVQLAARITF